jgi:hypothetical protein
MNPSFSVRKIILLAISFTLFLTISTFCFAASIPSSERKEILDVARPVVTAVVGQPIKFIVDHLNVDSNWAILVGGLVKENGSPVDWSKAASCNADLDNILWVVLVKADGQWRIAQMDVCAGEPPYWGMGYLWPCGVYKGLTEGERNLEVECHREHGNSK